MTAEDFFPALERVQAGETLDEDAAATAFDVIMGGRVAEDDLTDFLLALNERGPAIAEITGAARAMRSAMLTIDPPEGAIDIVGTGGDGHDTFNISTATALVVASCGVPVAKHGNRSASSRSGTADVLERLGVKLDVPPEFAEACLHEAGIAFLFAPTYHPAMKFVAPVRRKLGVRTIFNLLGPLCNPANVKRQLMGVFAGEWTEPLAHVLKSLGTEKAWVVHGSDGLDEITTTGPTSIAVLENGAVTMRDIVPEDIGIARATLADLKGGEPEDNARALVDLLGGARGAFRDVTILNSAAALVVADIAADLQSGAMLAAEAIDSGNARAALDRLVAVSNRARP